MTNAELISKIKAEIERLQDENNNIRCDSNKAYCQGYGDAFVDLLPFLYTLESEKPIGEEYVIEIGKYAHTLRAGSQSDIDNLIRQKEREQQSEGLKEEIQSFWKENGPMSHAEYDRLAKCARYFAQWGAEHLKK